MYLLHSKQIRMLHITERVAFICRHKYGVGGFCRDGIQRVSSRSFGLGPPGPPFILVTVIPVETKMRDIRGI